MNTGAHLAHPIRVMIVDDHDVVHWGFRLMLSDLPWIERSFSARSRAEAIELGRRFLPDVALIDLFVAEESGPEICEQLLGTVPEIKVLLISGAGRISSTAVRACGAVGFVPKSWPAADIARALRMVALGMSMIEADAEAPDTAVPLLTERELDVLKLIATGATNREIAATLNLSPHTIKEHASTLYRKLDARNRAEAVQRAQRLGVLA
ncbi:LuxR C-terminal-related transcriptional regulator [Conexibacter sp. DBS9H8]|uniref:response regulator transcription factor n=1 Tax=Conexibacter sp. DBS9H8 TaxID=2937801 RepID=UPI00200EB3FC|nr:response regulator transcription factor [Conexibacter sp. DBS9H8]